MKVFENIFEELDSESNLTSKIISKEINNALKEVELDLTEKQTNLIIESILLKNDIEEKDLNLSKEQIDNSGLTNTHALKIIEDVLTKHFSSFDTDDSVENNFKTIKDEYLEKYVKETLEEAPSFLEKSREETRSFKERLMSLWGYPLDLLEVLIYSNIEIGSKYQKQLPFLAEDIYFTHQALLRLHAKACQTSLEILTLLKSGFADGANARWRLLYEIVVISYFIKEHGNDLAKRFLDYDDVSSYQASILFQEHAEKLGYEPNTEKEMELIQDRIESLNQKYGIKYKKGGYGWAGSVLNKDKPTFSDIEKNVNQDHMKPFFKRASQSVHAGAKGLFSQLGTHPSTDVLLCGPSNYGLADPCRFTAIYLNKITVNFVLVGSKSPSFLVASELLIDLQGKIETSSIEIEDGFDINV
jgi:hypothetical protein